MWLLAPSLVKIQDLVPGLDHQEPAPDQDTGVSLVQANRRPGNLYPSLLHIPASNVLCQLKRFPPLWLYIAETSQSHPTQLSSPPGTNLALAFSEDVQVQRSIRKSPARQTQIPSEAATIPEDAGSPPGQPEGLG